MRALIVDDSRAMRMVISRIVTDLGFSTATAGDGRDALQQLSTGELPDVVLTDWNMPEMNGFDLLLAIRATPELASIPVVMITTETEIGQLSKALEHGASEYVMKPFTPEILRDKLEMLGLMGATG